MASEKITALIEEVKALTVLEPVSYTHLDVYKRQIWWSEDRKREFNQTGSACSVSHSDRSI